MKILRLIALVTLLGCGHHNPEDSSAYGHHPDIDLAVPQVNATAGNFADCAELSTWLQTKQQQLDYYISYVDGPPPPSNVSGPVPSAPSISSHVAGVTDPDSIAVDNNRIFVARAQSIEILTQSDFQSLQTLVLSDLGYPQIFAANGQLIVVGYSFQTGTSPSEAKATYEPFVPARPNYEFAIEVYQVGASGTDYVLQSRQSLTGQLVGVRLTGSVLTVVTEDQSSWDSPDSISNGTFHGVACADIRKPLRDDFGQAITHLYRIPVDGSGPPTHVAAWGRTDALYVTQNHLYLASTGMSWFPWDTRVSDDAAQTLTVAKFNLGATATFAAAGTALGWPQDSGSFKESLDQNSLFLITRYAVGSTAQNYRLWTLSASGTSLNTIGASNEYPLNGYTFSVVFADAKAYVTNDSLNIFDLSQPAYPTLLNTTSLALEYGALEAVSGHSLLSLAQTQSGPLQLSLVDVTQPSTPVLVTSRSLGITFSNSQLLSDPDAFYSDGGLVALPVTLTQSNLPGTGNAVQFSGALLLDTTSSLAQVGQVSHSEWIPADCQYYLANAFAPSMDVRRVINVNGRLLSASPFGIKVSDPQKSFAVTASLQFNRGANECFSQRDQPYGGSFYGDSPFGYGGY